MTATILCIEDEEDFLAELVEELEGEGYRLLTARSRAEALRILSECAPASIDCVISDIMLPDGPALDLIPLIRGHRALSHRAPYLLLTALSTREDVLQGLEAGADDYLTKPVDLAILAAMVRRRFAMMVRMTSLVPPTREGGVHLSRRETEVLAHIAAGARSQEIASDLGLSKHTINQYIKEVYRKLNISSRAEATRIAIERGLDRPLPLVD